MLHVFVYLLVLLIACYFQAITGFGQGLIIAPLVLVLFGKFEALSILMIIGLGLNAYLITQVKARLDVNLMKRLLIGCVFGLPLGLMVVKAVSLAHLQIIAGVASILLVLLFVFSKVKLSRANFYLPVAGILSGAMQTSMGLAGPPVVILLNAQSTPPQVMRKTLPTYFFVVGILVAAVYLLSGVVSAHGVYTGLLSLPFVIVAGYFGNRHGHIMPEKYYRLMVVMGVLLTGLVAIYQGLRS